MAKLLNSESFDQYLWTFTVPRWNRPVRVTDDHRLFKHLPEFKDWTKAQHSQRALDYAVMATAVDTTFNRALRQAFALYGNGNGVLVPGCYREHFPEPCKDWLRLLGRTADMYRSRSVAHWQAAGKRLQTWHAMANV